MAEVGSAPCTAAIDVVITIQVVHDFWFSVLGSILKKDPLTISCVFMAAWRAHLS